MPKEPPLWTGRLDLLAGEEMRVEAEDYLTIDSKYLLLFVKWTPRNTWSWRAN